MPGIMRLVIPLEGDYSVMDAHDQTRPTQEPPATPPSKRLLPLTCCLAIVAVLVVAVIFLRRTDVLGDRGNTNVASWLLSFLAMATLVGWFLFLSGYSRRIRMVSLVGLVALVGGLAALLRVERISGELVPEFALRFSPKPDERLETAKLESLAAGSADPVDLLSTTAGDFPQFLGPDRSMSLDGIELGSDWARRPPVLRWRRAIGAGWSAFSVVNGYAVTMEQRGDLEMIVCYRLETGEPQWAHSIATRYESISGGVGPRSTPTIDGGLVYVLGATGHLLCLDGRNGECRWQRNLLEDYGISVEDESSDLPWARSNSPLIVDELVIVPAGGPKKGRKVSLVAYDKRTGELAWEGGDKQISYSSPIVATLAGTRQIVSIDEDSVSGHEIETGKVLWEHPWPARSNANPNVSQPVVVDTDRLLLSKGYGAGAVLLQITREEDPPFTPEVVWRNRRVLRTKFTSAAVRGDHAYALSDGILECVDLKTGQRVWKDGRYGHGQILMVGDRILVLAESGEIVLVQATPHQPNHVFGRFQALEGLTWNNIALSGPYLLVRNAEQATCYELPLAQ